MITFESVQFSKNNVPVHLIFDPSLHFFHLYNSLLFVYNVQFFSWSYDKYAKKTIRYALEVVEGGVKAKMPEVISKSVGRQLIAMKHKGQGRLVIKVVVGFDGAG